jgi:hypothetical protein
MIAALLVLELVGLTGCGGAGGGRSPDADGDTDDPGRSSGALPRARPAPAELPAALLLALSPFEIGPDGKATATPDAARLEILRRAGGRWQVETLTDPESNVFHKAMAYEPVAPGEAPGILTLAGSGAAIKLWRRAGRGFEATTLWKADFGGRFSRMRDGELGDLDGDGDAELAVATHDQGIVAMVELDGGDGPARVVELDRQADTFVHEIELGDLDGDGTTEIYATPSEPNRMDGTPQSGTVVRYVPARGIGREVVIDLGERHAKEILVDDVDGDGTDELYVSVEGELGGSAGNLHLVQQVEIRRVDATDAPPATIARLPDHLCRFLTAGDLDGDGRREMVAATFQSGLWLLRPGDDPRRPWQITSIDRDSGGFEHAALLADLDGDGTDELYVASDQDGEVRRYVWQDGTIARQTIHRREVPGAVFTWNLMPVPVTILDAVD